MSAAGGKIATTGLRHPTRLEENFLRQCLEFPGAIHHVNRLLSYQKQSEVSAADFGRAEDKALLAIIVERATMPTVAPIAELCDSLDSVLAQRVKTLLTLTPTPGNKLERLPEALALSVLDWRLEKIREYNTILKQLLPSGGQAGSDDELTQSYLAQVPEMERIHQARDALSMTGQRRAKESRAAKK